MIVFRDRRIADLGLKLIVHTNRMALRLVLGRSPMVRRAILR